MLKRAVFIEPTYEEFSEDRLFDAKDQYLNRDNQLLPFVRLREAYARKGIPVHTADYLRSGMFTANQNDYWSLGDAEKYKVFIDRHDVNLRVFLMLEPPLIKPATYKKMQEICKDFQLTYLFNIDRDGYSLPDEFVYKVRKAYCPQPYEAVVESYWNNTDRLNKLVVIAGNHNPRFKRPEYYSARINAIADLINLDAIDLYGRGWDKWWTLRAAWPSYWLNFNSIQRAYRGACESKLDVLSRYRFSLCFENGPMRGYITEKIFDCLYAGVVPVYLGAPDIKKYIPDDVFVNMRDFNSYVEMYSYVKSMPHEVWLRKRAAGKDFINNLGRANYANSLINIMNEIE